MAKPHKPEEDAGGLHSFAFAPGEIRKPPSVMHSILVIGPCTMH
jgi:hypothetical protein